MAGLVRATWGCRRGRVNRLYRQRRIIPGSVQGQVSAIRGIVPNSRPRNSQPPPTKWTISSLSPSRRCSASKLERGTISRLCSTAMRPPTISSRSSNCATVVLDATLRSSPLTVIRICSVVCPAARFIACSVVDAPAQTPARTSLMGDYTAFEDESDNK